MVSLYIVSLQFQEPTYNIKGGLTVLIRLSSHVKQLLLLPSPLRLTQVVTCPKLTGHQGEGQQQTWGGVRAMCRATRLSAIHAEPFHRRQTSAQGSTPGNGNTSATRLQPASHQSQVTNGFHGGARATDPPGKTSAHTWDKPFLFALCLVPARQRLRGAARAVLFRSNA